MIQWHKQILIVFLIIFLCLTSYADQFSIELDQVWPTPEWQTATPESQGAESKILLKMFLNVLDNHYDLDSITIVRNGYLIFDGVIPPFTTDQAHDIFSCTKSVTSALIGIAIDKGYIKSVDEKMISFFMDRQVKNMAEQKKEITIQHLLTMSSGLVPSKSDVGKNRGTKGLFNTDDWAQAVLDRPVTGVPGNIFEYNNGGSYLLSAILQKATGKRAKEFADEHLFGPLGIKDAQWEMCPMGISIGGSAMDMHPHDMAKIGWLYLNYGKWKDQQIISEDWIKASTKPYTASAGSAAMFDGYGYQWWLNSEGYYSAWGAGGQHIYVFPEKRMVVVFTGRLSSSYSFIPKQVLDQFILKASQSNQALTPNPKASSRLVKLIKRLNRVKPEK